MEQSTSPRKGTHTRRLFAIMLLLVGGLALLALTTNLRMLARATSIVESTQASWSSVFPVDHPDFKERFSQSLRSDAFPWRPDEIHSLGETYVWAFVIAVGMVFWYSHRTRKERASSVNSLLPALTPALLGLAIAPLMVVPMIAALPEQGLSNPGAAGATVGLATRTVCIGTVLSLILMLGLFGRRGTESEPHSL